MLVIQDLTCHELISDILQPGGTPGDTTQSTPPEVPPRVIGDFDDNASGLFK